MAPNCRNLPKPGSVGWRSFASAGLTVILSAWLALLKKFLLRTQNWRLLFDVSGTVPAGPYQWLKRARVGDPPQKMKTLDTRPCSRYFSAGISVTLTSTSQGLPTPADFLAEKHVALHWSHSTSWSENIGKQWSSSSQFVRLAFICVLKDSRPSIGDVLAGHGAAGRAGPRWARISAGPWGSRSRVAPHGKTQRRWERPWWISRNAFDSWSVTSYQIDSPRTGSRSKGVISNLFAKAQHWMAMKARCFSQQRIFRFSSNAWKVTMGRYHFLLPIDY